MAGSVSHNSNILYYLKAGLAEFMPRAWWELDRRRLFSKLGEAGMQSLRERVDYYNRLSARVQLPDTAQAIGSLRKGRRGSVYYYDARAVIRYFPPHLKAEFRFGDVTEIPPVPAMLKSRPIAGDIANSVVLKMEQNRHFNFIDDPVPFARKKDLLIGYAAVNQEHRRRFYRQYFNNPRCVLGQINRGTEHDEWLRKKISIRNHLDYKFILCLEGHDVASNLKWVMSSSSLAVMPEPTYETWYMEGTLLPGVHYVPIRKDFSDLEEKMDYYLSHPAEAQDIIRNANEYTRKFLHADAEQAIGLLVMEKYFIMTGQLPTSIFN